MDRIHVNIAMILRAVPVLVILAGVAADFLGPEPYGGLPFLVAAPLVGGLVLRWWTSLAVAVATCLTSVVTNLRLDQGPAPLLTDLLIIIAVSVIGLWTKWLMARQAHSLEVTRDIAVAAQQAILPEPPTRLRSLNIAARYEAAQVEARVGGDLYAVQATPFGIRAIIGDVRGKGLQAVSKVAMVIATFRNEADNAATLSELADRLNNAFIRAKDPGRIDYDEDFLTALIVEVSPDATTVSLLNRGHIAPYLMCPGRVEQLAPSLPAPPLGLDVPIPQDEIRLDTIPWAPGEILLLVTDGITEARDRQGVFYDPRVQLADTEYSSPREAVDALTSSVTRWTHGRRQDDIAILALSRTQS